MYLQDAKDDLLITKEKLHLSRKGAGCSCFIQLFILGITLVGQLNAMCLLPDAACHAQQPRREGPIRQLQILGPLQVLSLQIEKNGHRDPVVLKRLRHIPTKFSSTDLNVSVSWGHLCMDHY